jgi:hypothetical protein
MGAGGFRTQTANCEASQDSSFDNSKYKRSDLFAVFPLNQVDYKSKVANTSFHTS